MGIVESQVHVIYARRFLRAAEDYRLVGDIEHWSESLLIAADYARQAWEQSDAGIEALRNAAESQAIHNWSKG